MRIAKKLFGRRFIGVFVVAKPSDAPKLKEGQIAILNTNEHWYGIYKKDGSTYETDSYGTDNLPHIRDRKPPEYFRQGRGRDLMDCGQRLLTNLALDAA